MLREASLIWVALSVLTALVSTAAPVMAFSTASVKFFGATDVARDRITVRVDPPTPADVGSGSFTIELWLRGAKGAQSIVQGDYRPAGSEAAYTDWINGNIFVDRDINGSPPPGSGDFGAAIHRAGGPSGGGVIRFGVENGSGSALTVQGTREVLDDAWHHVALVRDAAAGRLRIYVDGTLDVESVSTAPAGDLSYPDGFEGDSRENPLLVFAAEKHAFPGYSGFVGYLDEIRVWNLSRSERDIAANRFTSLSGSVPGLVLSLRLEEGGGTTLTDATGLNTARLFSGEPGNGEWTTEVPAAPAPSTTSTSSTTTTSSTTSTVTTSTTTVLASTTSTATSSTTSTSTSSTTTTTTSTSSSTSTSSAVTTTSTTAPGAVTTSSSAATPSSTTTSTTAQPECATDEDCDDGDPCTAERCSAHRCVPAPLPDLTVARCRAGGTLGRGACTPPGAIGRRLARRLARDWRELQRVLARAEASARRGGGDRVARLRAAAARRLVRVEAVAQGPATKVSPACAAAVITDAAAVRAALGSVR